MSFIGKLVMGYMLWSISHKVSAIFVIITIVHAVALASTLYRFQHRHKHNIQFWRDDAFAILTTFGALFMLGVLASNGEIGPSLLQHVCLTSEQ